ncbi:MAG: GAF domain-containing protein [Rhodoferax sp.]|nr:GAF domain-containing protein [Rhodoferax sp.]
MQRPPAGLEGPAFEAQFYRQLQRVTTLVHQAGNLDRIVQECSADICRLFDADRMTLYAVHDDGSSIVSRVKTGLGAYQNIQLPISPRSVAGFVAHSRQLVNLPDVYDEASLRRVHPDLSFLKTVDKRTGYRTRQVLAVPIVEGQQLFGVLQLINRSGGQGFSPLEVDGAQQLCQALSLAFRRRLESVESGLRRKATKYDGLVALGVVSAEQLEQCWNDARRANRPVEQVLMAQHPVRPAQIGASLSRFFGVPYEPMRPHRSRIEALHGKLKRDFVERQGWLPLEDAPEGLVVLCLDPEAVRGARIVPQVFPKFAGYSYRVTTQAEFHETLAQVFGSGMAAESIDDMLAGLDEGSADEGGDDDLQVPDAADNELVRLVNKVIVDAVQQQASDIHIEPLAGRQKTGIRFRIDGVLAPYIEVPAHYRQAMVTRLKIMADLDISERRRPQDGKILFRKFGPLDIELRVATIPSAGGVEDVVMRVLTQGEPIPLGELGLTDHNRERVVRTVENPHGLFYVCGPTGSGKTTTLHSILSHLNRPETKIWTVEDPVEITQRGLRQVQVNRKAGIDFALVMRAFLRADPDIIMVGESRDQETVAMGIEASLTGHLVFSTLHTNSAPESVVRLLDMGMDPFHFADALLGILAQRLARKLCDCKQAQDLDGVELDAFVSEYAQELRLLPQWQSDPHGQTRALLADWRARFAGGGSLRLYHPVGCASCAHTGYKGRIGLHELLIADEEIKRLIQQRARVAEVLGAAVRAGMHTLKMDGMEKALMGWTDLKMVRSVCLR